MPNLRNYSCTHRECKLYVRLFSVQTEKWRSYYTCPQCDEFDAQRAKTREHLEAMERVFNEPQDDYPDDPNWGYQ